MKIAIIAGIFFPHPGGVQVQIHNICNKLTELGHKTDCYIYNKCNISNNLYNIKLINKFITSLIYFFEYYFTINLKFILKLYLKKKILKNQYDVYHFHFLNFKSLIIIDCLKDLNQKIIVTFHGADIQVDSKINYGYRLNLRYSNYLKKILPKIDKFFYISSTIKEDLLKFGVKKSKLFYSPNFVCIDKFKKLKKDKKIKKKLNLITVARFAEKKKGYDILIEIAKKLVNHKINFKWIIIGDKSEKLFQNNIFNNYKKNFIILGNIENRNEKYYPNSKLIRYYSNSNLYVNLARVESFGITFVESLASRTPIISFKTRGANEIIKNKFNGYLVDNKKKLINKILQLYKNKNLLRTLDKNLIPSIKKYDADYISKKIIYNYKQVLKEKN